MCPLLQSAEYNEHESDSKVEQLQEVVSVKLIGCGHFGGVYESSGHTPLPGSLWYW
jgi:hypothetical protein